MVEGPEVAEAERSALRTFIDGGLSAIDAAEQAQLSVSAFLDLVERVQAADASHGGATGAAAGMPPDAPVISVVVPVYNEEGNIVPLLEVLVPVLASIGSYEVVFVDDGSTDRSRPIVLGQRAIDPSIKLVELARNFGHQGALSAGIDHASGQAVIFMDADLQDPPSVIPQMVERWREGYEVVYAVREKRKDGPVLRACAAIFYRLLRRISEIDLPLDSGDFCLMDRRVATAIRELPETNRFLRGLRGWVGFRQTAVPCEREARHAGDSKYSIRRRVRFALDGLLSFSDIPLRLASFAGFLAMLAAIAYFLVAVGTYLVGGEVVEGWSVTILVVLLLGGVQLMLLGVVGEYISRIYQEAKRRPPYLVRSTHGAHRVGRTPHERPAPR